MVRVRIGLMILMVLCGTLIGATERPRDPWVFRCVLDQRPRMVVLALHESLWTAYDATTCSLYKAWRGDVKFQGAVYDSVHGPQPVTRGDVLLKSGDDTAWQVMQGGQALAIKPVWRGYRLEDDRVTLLFELKTEHSGSIGIEERVDVEQVTGETAQLVRSISTRSVPPGISVAVTVTRAQTNNRPVPISVDGSPVSAEPGTTTQSLPLKSNGPTLIETTLRFPVQGESQSQPAKGARQ